MRKQFLVEETKPVKTEDPEQNLDPRILNKDVEDNLDVRENNGKVTLIGRRGII